MAEPPPMFPPRGSPGAPAIGRGNIPRDISDPRVYVGISKPLPAHFSQPFWWQRSAQVLGVVLSGAVGVYALLFTDIGNRGQPTAMDQIRKWFEPYRPRLSDSSPHPSPPSSSTLDTSTSKPGGTNALSQLFGDRRNDSTRLASELRDAKNRKDISQTELYSEEETKREFELARRDAQSFFEAHHQQSEQNTRG